MDLFPSGRVEDDMPKQQLLLRLPATVLAFRGYNVTNLGRTAELLAHPAYGPTVEKHLRAASVTAADVLRRPVSDPTTTKKSKAGEDRRPCVFDEDRVAQPGKRCRIDS